MGQEKRHETAALNSCLGGFSVYTYLSLYFFSGHDWFAFVTLRPYNKNQQFIFTQIHLFLAVLNDSAREEKIHTC